MSKTLKDMLNSLVEYVYSNISTIFAYNPNIFANNFEDVLDNLRCNLTTIASHSSNIFVNSLRGTIK